MHPSGRPIQQGQGGPPGSMAEAVTMCKIELPVPGAGDDQFGGTRTVASAYKFSADQQIGEGTYGQVFKGTDMCDNHQVALKKIRMDTEKEGFPITAIREIKILSSLKHENVVNLREIVRSEIHRNNNYKGSIYMVFDYADYDLTGLMESARYKFTEPQVKCIMKQVLRGLTYCHGNGVLHRDLKASNILIDSSGTVKLADFGLARPYQDRHEGKLTNRVITLWYRPPELLLGAEKYGPEVDMWSVGCIFAELLVGKPIFPGGNETDQVDKIFSIMGTPNEQTWPGVSSLPFWPNVAKERYKKSGLRDWVRERLARHAAGGGGHHFSNEAINLLERLLTLDPAKRISAKDALLTDWFFHNVADPSELPCHGSSHEFTMKKRRNEQREKEEAMMQQQMRVGYAPAPQQQGGQGQGQDPSKRGRYQQAPYQAGAGPGSAPRQDNRGQYAPQGGGYRPQPGHQAPAAGARPGDNRGPGSYGGARPPPGGPPAPQQGGARGYPQGGQYGSQPQPQGYMAPPPAYGASSAYGQQGGAGGHRPPAPQGYPPPGGQRPGAPGQQGGWPQKR